MACRLSKLSKEKLTHWLIGVPIGTDLNCLFVNRIEYPFLGSTLHHFTIIFSVIFKSADIFLSPIWMGLIRLNTKIAIHELIFVKYYHVSIRIGIDVVGTCSE